MSPAYKHLLADEELNEENKYESKKSKYGRIRGASSSSEELESINSFDSKESKYLPPNPCLVRSESNYQPSPVKDALPRRKSKGKLLISNPFSEENAIRDLNLKEESIGLTIVNAFTHKKNILKPLPIK